MGDDMSLLSFDRPNLLGVTWPEGQKFPEPRVEVEAPVFWGKFLSEPWFPESIVYGQFFETDDHYQGYWTCYVGFSLRKAFMVATRYCRGDEVRYAHVPANGKYVYQVRFFLLGCEHPNMREMNLSMHTHVYVCPTCGLRYETDSSG